MVFCNFFCDEIGGRSWLYIIKGVFLGTSEIMNFLANISRLDRLNRQGTGKENYSGKKINLLIISAEKNFLTRVVEKIK